MAAHTGTDYIKGDDGRFAGSRPSVADPQKSAARAGALAGVRVCSACGDPSEPVADGATVCDGCWYDGRQLAAAFVTEIEQLNTATGRTWVAEHTGGGCFVIGTTDDDGNSVLLSPLDGPFTGDGSPADIEAQGGWMVGMYGEIVDGEYLEAAPDALNDVVTVACSRALRRPASPDWAEEGFGGDEEHVLTEAGIELPLAMDWMQAGTHDVGEMIARHQAGELPPHET